MNCYCFILPNFNRISFELNSKNQSQNENCLVLSIFFISLYTFHVQDLESIRTHFQFAGVTESQRGLIRGTTFSAKALSGWN